MAALGAISNIVVDFTTRRSTFIRLGGVKLLVQLSKSMDATIRLNALCALRNLIFLAEDKCKEEIFMELTASLLANLICGNDLILLLHSSFLLAMVMPKTIENHFLILLLHCRSRTVCPRASFGSCSQSC